MINQDSSVVSDASSITSIQSRAYSNPPPESKDEWLRRESIPEWPLPMMKKDLVKADNILSDSVEAIENDLKKHAKYDSNFLDRVSKKLEDLETNVAYLSDFFLTDTHRPSIKPSTSGGLSNLPKHAFLQQLFNSQTLERTKLDADNEVQVEEKRTPENVVFPGISSELLTVPLPYQLEALHILDLITKSQKFPKSFVKAWKKSYYSEASIAVFQNTFWWICMERYKPNAQVQAELFNQVSESFLLLLLNVSQKHKDEFFKWYPQCLAQAVYSAFCHSFKDARQIFNDDLRECIAGTILQWTMGIRSTISSWTQWPLEAIDPYLHAGGEPDEKKSVSMSSSADKDILQTLEREASPHKSGMSLKSTARREGTAVVPSKSSEEQLTRSHSIGPGPTFERVQFNITGRSPLIQHFMSVHHLCDDTSSNYQTGPTLTRTEVKALGPPAPTYKQVMLHFQSEAERKYEEYERNMLRSNQVITKAQQKHRKLQQQMERLNREILSKKNEVKLLSEKLINRKQDFTVRRIKNTVAQKLTQNK